jgi:phospholipid transport system substrate-binding protein
MLNRRALLAGAAACLILVAAPRAWAQDDAATTFVKDFGGKLIQVVNSDAPLAEKQHSLRPLIDQAVDVDAIARFCLGRFVSSATPQQMTQFTTLFHAVLIDNITSKIGEYRGVTFKMTDTVMRNGEEFVGTIVQRPNNAPTNVRWVVSTATGSPKIVDVIAEGTSLRVTQRSDYSSYLSHNGNDVNALLGAMRRQVSASSS